MAIMRFVGLASRVANSKIDNVQALSRFFTHALFKKSVVKVIEVRH